MGGKVSCAPNSCEARSQVSLLRIYQKSLFRFVVKRLIFGLFWLQISAEKIYNKNEHMFDYYIRVRIWQRNPLFNDVFQLSHDASKGWKKMLFFLYDYRWIFIWCSSTNFRKILNFKLQLSGRTYVRVTCSSLYARPHRSSLFIRCSFQLICQIFDNTPSAL